MPKLVEFEWVQNVRSTELPTAITVINGWQGPPKDEQGKDSEFLEEAGYVGLYRIKGDKSFGIISGPRSFRILANPVPKLPKNHRITSAKPNLTK